MEIADELRKLKDLFNDTSQELKSFSRGELTDIEKENKEFLENVLDVCQDAAEMTKKRVRVQSIQDDYVIKQIDIRAKQHQSLKEN